MKGTWHVRRWSNYPSRWARSASVKIISQHPHVTRGSKYSNWSVEHLVRVTGNHVGSVLWAGVRDGWEKSKH